MVTDNIGDFIIRLKNANLVGKESVSIYTSKIKESVADALVRAGFVKSFSKNKNGKTLEVVLAYNEDKTPRITDVSRISKPSRRIYKSVSELKPAANRIGLMIISTPAGVLSNKEAYKQKVGGEVMFKIW
jgi:small subunit ribosomal protein S8